MCPCVSDETQLFMSMNAARIIIEDMIQCDILRYKLQNIVMEHVIP